MKQTASKITYKDCLKKSSSVIGFVLLVRIVTKIMTNFAEMKFFIQELIKQKQVILGGFTLLVFIISLWLISSLLGGLAYYGYQKLTAKIKNYKTS